MSKSRRRSRRKVQMVPFSVTKYQGNEFQVTLQAPTQCELDKTIRDFRAYAKANDYSEFEVLTSGKDPDGGYKAIIVAHNWNPISWVKEKIEGLRRKKVPDEPPTINVPGTEYKKRPEDVKKEEEQAWRDFMERTKREAEIEKIRREYARKRAKRLRELEDIGKAEALEEEIQQKVRDLPPEHRKAAAKELKEAWRSRQQAEIEIAGANVPEKIKQKQKIFQEAYWTKKGTNIPVPEPKTPEEREQADYHPRQWVFVDVERELHPLERARIARAQEFERMELDIVKEKYKQFKRERHPAYRTAKVAQGIGQFMAQTATLGVAGMARGMRPGRGGPERAIRMHAPGVPLELYAVRPVLGVGMPTARDLTGSGLERLRLLTFPGIRRTRQQVQQVRRRVRP